MANNKCMIAPCNTVEDLEACMALPQHCVPTVEFAVKNINLPLSADDYAYLNQEKINLFAANQPLTASQARSIARSSKMSDPTLTIDVPFILMGVCVYAYGEPNAMSIAGNCFARNKVDNHAPASPLNLRNHQATLQAMTSAGNLTAADVNPAVIEWGHAVRSLIWAFMHSRRLVMQCPTSSYETLVDESLADVGNSCSQTEWGGFGSSKADHMLYTRMVNDRLTESGFTPANNEADPGVFVPCNCDITGSSTNELLIEPVRLMPDFMNVGRSLATPSIESWFKLPFPIAFPTVPQQKIKLTLDKSDSGDDPYLERALAEGCLRNLLPEATLSQFFPLVEPAPFAGSLGYANEIHIPGGQLRIGIGLKGFEVRESVCNAWHESMDGGDQKNMMKGAIKNCGCGVRVGNAGPVGSPDRE